MSSDLESTLAQIRELKLQLSGGTPSDPKNAQTNLDPKHKNESTSGQATAANSKPATSKDAASMSTEKQGDDAGSTSRAAGAMGMAGATGDNARPTSNLVHSDSRDNTHDGFGGCSSPCNRYGEQTQQDSQQPGSLSPSTSHTATIPESKSVVNSENPNRPHGQDVENTSPFVSTPEKEVKDRKDEAVETLADESSAPKESHVPPESHAAIASTSKPSPYPIGPGDQVIEHVKRIHQGGMAPGPDGKPTPTPGKTLLTTISSQGTTYALSDKDLPPGQQVVETLETIYEGFELPEAEGAATLAPATPNKRRWSWFAPMSSPGSAKASPAKGVNVLAAAPPSGPSDAQTPAGPTEGAPATPERPGQQKVKSGFLDTLIGRSPSKRSEEKARSQEAVVAESAPAPSAAAPEAQNQETTTTATSPAVGPSDVEQPPSSQAPEATPSPNVGVNERPAQQRGWSGFLESLKARSPSKHAKAEQGNVQQFENVAEAPEAPPAPPSNVQSPEGPKPAVINLNEEPPRNPQQPAQDTVSPNIDATQRPAQPRGRSGLFGTLVGRGKEKGKGREPESAAEGAPESSSALAAPEGQSQEVKSAAAVNPAEVALPASPKDEEPPRTPAADVAERPAQQRGRPSFFETLIGRSPGKHAREEKGKAGEIKDVGGAPTTAPSATNVEAQKPPNAEAVAAEVSDVLKAGEVEDQDPGAVPAPEPSTSQSAEVAHAPETNQANVESTPKPQVAEGTLSPNVAPDERPPQTKKRSSFFGGLLKSPSKHVYEEKGKAEKPDSSQQEPAAAPPPAGPKEASQDTSTSSAANPPAQPATAEAPTSSQTQTAEEAPSPSPNVKSGFLDTLMGRSPSKHVDKVKLKEQDQPQPQPQDTSTSEGQGAVSQSEAPSVPQTSAQDQGTAGAPSPEHHWFDRFLDGLGGRKEKVVPPVQN